MKPIDRRTFTASVAAGLVATSVQAAAEQGDAPVGPMVGHVSATTAHVWYRPAVAGQYELKVHSQEGAAKLSTATSLHDNDRCLTWRIEGLKPATRYQYSILSATKTLLDGDDYYFETAPEDGVEVKVRLAFGSCAHSKPLELWAQMKQHGAEGLVLLSDTPYIDSTNLETARRKHRDFLAVPQLAKIIRNMPVWATWDDHDFGRNDSDGRLPGKEGSRQAFVEYRANESFGDQDQGIYTKFRRGPVEVFLLDTRWFARTEPSPVDPKKLTLLGKRQWDWLLESLANSTATFKVIACGMIWDDKKNRESDDWDTYSHERSALFDFLGENNISGVVLIGGDIHCSRLLRYKTEQQVGYPLHQMIVSPIHSSTISSLNVPHPDLIQGAAIPHVWLQLEVDSTVKPATLHAQWVQMDGRKMWDLRLSEHDLRKPV